MILGQEGESTPRLRTIAFGIALLLAINVLDGAKSLHRAFWASSSAETTASGNSDTSARVTASDNIRASDSGHRSEGGRFAVAQYVEGYDQFYGVYSIHKQMAKHGMLQGRYFDDTLGAGDDSRRKASHVVVVPSKIDAKLRNTLISWLGEENVRVVDKTKIHGLFRPSQALWKGVFNKLWLWNLTEYDKAIVLDSDILIRTNIMHWFDYDTPCAIQAKDDISWNSGAMVIQPDAKIFAQMLEQLPHVQRYDAKKGHKTDPLTGGYGQQAYVTSFFLNNTNQAKSRCVMPTEASVLSSSLTQETFHYYNHYRPWVYQTVHFTTVKPWRTGYRPPMKTKPPSHPFLCQLLREWEESMRGIEAYKDIKPIGTDYLAKCPPDATQQPIEPRTSPPDATEMLPKNGGKQLIDTCFKARNDTVPLSLYGKGKLQPPFINLGLPDLGSTSLFGFFRCGGYNATHDICPFGDNNTWSQCGTCMHDSVEQGLPPLEKCGLQEQVQVWAQMDQNVEPVTYPQIDYLDLLLDSYPNATYFLGFRSMAAWYHSMAHWDKRPLAQESPTSMASRLKQANITGFPSGFGSNAAEFSAWFCWHVSRVRLTIAKHPSSTLVEFDIEDAQTAQRMSSIFGIKEGCWRQTNANAEAADIS